MKLSWSGLAMRSAYRVSLATACSPKPPRTEGFGRALGLRRPPDRAPLGGPGGPTPENRHNPSQAAGLLDKSLPRGLSGGELPDHLLAVDHCVRLQELDERALQLPA